ncbi:flap endonuclease Xni [Shewanella waksmanii]|uniref:flap endonuclease Xni n=1 Tax=Shewanella waksmanii TaxID=213783 RepID=UPI003734E9EE
MNTLLIIDGLNLVRRMHAAQKDDSHVDGLAQRLSSACQKLIKYHHPSHAVIVWDGKQESWRKRLFEDYKKDRKPMPAALESNLSHIKGALADDGVFSIDADSEADDVIATLATKLVKAKGAAIIVSTDKGFTQLTHPQISQWDHFAQAPITIAERESKLGVDHGQFIDYLALAGDSGNKVPGVPGIGPKSAMELLRTYRTLANIYASIDNIGAKQAKKLQAGKQLARLSYKLVQLQTDIPLQVNLSQFRVSKDNSKCKH